LKLSVYRIWIGFRNEIVGLGLDLKNLNPFISGSQLQTFVICSASYTKPNRYLIFSFVQSVLGGEDTLSTLLVNVI